MSLALEPVKTIQVLDPRLDIGEMSNEQFAAHIGGQVLYQSIASTSATNTNNLLFQTPIPDNCILSKQMYVEYTVNCTMVVTAAAAGTRALNSQLDAPRAWPLAMASSLVSVRLNGVPFQADMGNWWAAMQHKDGKRLRKLAAGVPNFPDYLAIMSSNSGSNRSALATIGSSVIDEVLPRGAFPITISTNPASADAGDITSTFSFTAREPVLVPPFGPYAQPGVTGITDLKVEYVLGNLNRLWSHADVAGNTFKSFSATITGATLHICQILPPPTLPLPSECVFNFARMQTLQSSPTAIGNGAAATLNISSASLTNLPSRLLIFVSPAQPTAIATTDSDTCLPISSVNITFNGQSGLLSTCSQHDLYRISAENGVDLTFSDFISAGMPTFAGAGVGTASIPLVGSVICLQWGKDLPNPVGAAPGSSGQWPISIQVTCTNNRGANLTGAQLIAVPFWDAVATIKDGAVIQQTALLQPSDVVEAPILSAPEQAYEGGEVFTSLKRGYAAHLRPTRKVGAGRSGGAAGGELIRVVPQVHKTGAGRSGGAAVTKATLRKLIM